MCDILKDLYEGNINPSMEVVPFTKEYETELREKTKSEDAFLSKLDKDMQNEFYNIMERWIKAYPLELREYFITGYKLGVKMTAEVYKD